MLVLILTLLGIFGAASGQFSLSSKARSLQSFGASNGVDTFIWSEQVDPAGTRAHKAMSKWLEAFFAATPGSDLAPPAPLLPSVRSKSSNTPIRKLLHEQESPYDPHFWKVWSNETNCDTLVATSPPIEASQRRFLIIAPVGSNFNASKWMTHPTHANYDIIALHYGKSGVLFRCPLCRAIVHGSGAKWGLLNRFLVNEAAVWAEMSNQYDAIMVADDDLDFYDTCTLNRIFEIFSSYNILLGQPSLCRTDHRSTYWDHLYQNDDSVLRYVTFVEIMAPIFRIDFFKGVVAPSLWNAYTGWGLDFTWPFLLRYPKKHIAVIDEVCMVHGNAPGESKGENNLYALPSPYNEREEESRRVAEYGYYPSRVEVMGYGYRGMETVGVVEKMYRSAEELPTPAAGLGKSKRIYVKAEVSRRWRWALLAVTGVVGVSLAATKLAAKRRQQHLLKARQFGRGRSPKHQLTAVP